MAKNIGMIQFKGKIGGLVGRDTRFGNILQTPGGFESERVKNDPIYEKTRQLNAEMAHCSRIASVLKSCLSPHLQLVSDPYVYNHIVRQLLLVKNCDTETPKGQKTFDKGLATKEGAAAFGRLSFNRERHTHNRLLQAESAQLLQGKLHLAAVSASDFYFPPAAPLLGIQLLLLRLDTGIPCCKLSSSAVQFIRKDSQSVSVDLQAAIPEGTGRLIAVVFTGYTNEQRNPIVWKRNNATGLSVLAFSQG